MNAGELDRRIVFQVATAAENSLGEAVPSWAELTRCWAKFVPGSGSEQRAAAQQESSLAATFITRWSAELAALTTEARIVFEGFAYDIKAIAELGRRDGLQFTAVTRYTFILRPLSGAIAASPSLSGVLGVVAPLAGSIVAGSGLVGDIGVLAPLVGTIAGGSEFVGDVSVDAVLEGAVTSGAGLAGTIDVRAALTGNIAGNAALVGDVVVTAPLTGAVTGAGALTGAVDVLATMAGGIVGSTGLAGIIVVAAPLAGSIAGSTAMAGLVRVAAPLAGVVSGTSSLSGALTNTSSGPTYVGGATLAFVGSTATENGVPLDGLTGGVSNVAEDGDVVIAIYSTGSNADRAIGPVAASFTEIAELYSNGSTANCNLSVSWSWLEDIGDDAVFFSPTGNNNDAGAAAISVWRGVDPSTPLDVASTTATGTGTARPNGSSITPATSGSMVLVCGGGATDQVSPSSFTQSGSELSHFISVASADLHSAIVGVGSKAWTGGAFDPAAWTGGTNNAGDSWAAVTLALRPAA